MTKFVIIGVWPRSLVNFRGQLLAALVDKGYDVHAVSAEADDGVVKALESMGVKHHSVSISRSSMSIGSDIKTFWQLMVLLRSVEPDYLLAYTAKPLIYGMFASLVARVPFRYALITGLGYVFLEQRKRGILRSLVKRLYALALKHTHKVFFQNPDDERLFRDMKLLPIDIPSCVVNGSGVDLDVFTPTRLPKKASFLLMARLMNGKGVREYVKAACRIRRRHPGIEFGMVGWIDDNPDSISQCELDAWIEEGCVSYYGRLIDVRPAISKCSVFVLPSYREGTPRSVLEAMAMGRAIITTDTPGCRETVVNGENGFLIPAKSIDALELAMSKFIDQPELISTMGERSRQIAEAKYDVHKVNAVMLHEMGAV